MSTHITSHYLPFREVYSHTYFPNLLVINFPIVLLQVADHPTKSLTTAQDWYRLVPLTISISRQWTIRCKVLPTRGLLTHCPSGMFQKRAFHTIPVYFEAVPVYHAVICRLGWVFSLSQLAMEYSPSSQGAGPGKEIGIEGIGVMGTWDTTSCNLLLTFWPTRVWSHIHHFYLVIELVGTPNFMA